MNLIQIRRAEPADAPALALLAARAFREAFETDYTAADMEAFLATAYALPKITSELSDPRYHCFVAEHDGGLLAYALLREGEPESCVTGPAPIELERIYVLQSAIGRGLGQQLLDRCIAHALATGHLTLWLGVWEHNPRGQAFYFRNGFEEVGSHQFLVGTSNDRDLILQKRLV